MNYHLVSEAIEKHLHSHFLPSVAEAIVREYGTEIARDVRAVYDLAMDCPVDWKLPQMDMNTALGILADFIAAELPNISPHAKTQLNYCYIMCWK